MDSNLWLYAIHSENPFIIHVPEEFNPIKNINDVIKESIKCHHNEITNYLLDMFDHDEHKLVDYCFLYDNFVSLPNIFYNNIFQKLCEYNCFDLFQNIIKDNIFKIYNYIHNFLYETFSFANNDFYSLNYTNAYELTYVKLPLSTDYINEKSFVGCFSLIKVIIPSSIISIKCYAFDGCYSLKEVIFDENVLSKKSDSEFHLNGNSIDYFAFRNCISLQEFKVPPSLTKIREFAFENCLSLTNISFHQSVTFIGNNAFANCPNIKINELKIPSSLKNIGFDIFSNDESLFENPKSFIIYDIPKYEAKELAENCFNNLLHNIKKVSLLPNRDRSINAKIGLIEFKTPYKVEEFASFIKKNPKTNIFNAVPTLDNEAFSDFIDNYY